MNKEQMIKLANELYQLLGIDLFDEEGHVNETEVTTLLTTISKFTGKETA